MTSKRVKHLGFLPDDVVYTTIESPVGELTLIGSGAGLHRVLWAHERDTDRCKILLRQCNQDAKHPILFRAKAQLDAYFKGQRQAFDLPLVLQGSVFQKKAWQVLMQIPYGQTMSYGEQAAALGDKNKARAVGLANGFNPLSIIVPCHRVIGSSGKLTGFGGGLERKAFLLALEKS